MPEGEFKRLRRCRSGGSIKTQMGGCINTKSDISKYNDVVTLIFSCCNDFFASLEFISLNKIDLFLIDFDMKGTGKAVDIIKEFKSKNSKIISIK